MGRSLSGATGAMQAAMCELGGRFSRCQNEAVQSCQYCGRRFCRAHAFFVGGHEAVCSRRQCRAKHEDMARHLSYRTRVAERNESGRCGVEDCDANPPGASCSLCKGLFCEAHIADRMYPTYDGYRSVDRPAAVCPHCWARRKIWRM